MTSRVDCQASSPSEDQLADRVAIVTGGTAGIGRATCVTLAKAGAHVVVVGRALSRVSDTLEELECWRKGCSRGLSLDIRREQDVEEMVRRTTDWFGRIDVLIASAGILRASGSPLKLLVQMSVAEWDEVLETNLRGLFFCNRAVLPSMIRQGSGHIINVSSTSGRRGYAFDSAYCASKFGVIGLSEAVAEEVRPYGIKVEALLPGAIDTSIWHQNGPLSHPDFALPADRVADLILYMLTLPDDVILVDPAIEPFRKPLRADWIGPVPTSNHVPKHGRDSIMLERGELK